MRFRIWLVPILALAISCKPNPTQSPPPPSAVPSTGAPSPIKTTLPTAFPSRPVSDIAFPKNFVFGTASSDFQTTGGNGKNDWVEKIKNFKPPQVAPGNGTDFFNRYREDFDLASQLGIQVHRISLEWSRLEPEDGKWDYQAAAKYREIFLALKAHHIEPMICLNHFVLPEWFSAQGGWENPQAARRYASYARFVASTIGKPVGVQWWLTFNEPQITLKEGYMKGTWPPYKTIQGWPDEAGTQRFIQTSGNLMDAHRLAYRAIHEALDLPGRKKVMVGFASAPGAFYPKDPDNPLDVIAYNSYNAIGTLGLDYLVGSDRDFIGLNFYARTLLHMYVNTQYMISVDKRHPVSVSWEYPLDTDGDHKRPGDFYPQALYDLIMKFKDTGTPIIITENGISDASDAYREEWIVIHLAAIHKAIQAGALVMGYMYWSLTDTWEWGGGFSQFGLIAIDREHGLARSIRPSAWTYRNIIKTKKISKTLLEKHRELLP